MQKRAGVLVAALALVACGTQATSSHPTPTRQAASSPTFTPAAQPKALVVFTSESGLGLVQANPFVVRFVREDGTEAARITVKAGYQVVGAGGAYVLLANRNGDLKGLRSDGSVVALGSIRDANANSPTPPNGVKASPDGTKWIWSDDRRAYLGGVGIPTRTVMTEQHGGNDPHGLYAYVWDTGGPVIVDNLSGLGGYYLYEYTSGPAYTVDPASGAVKPVGLKSDCYFADMSVDGTIACLHRGKSLNDMSVKIIRPDNRVLTVPIAAKYRQAGAIYFNRDGTKLTLSASPATGSEHPPEHYDLVVINVADGSYHGFGPTDVRPCQCGAQAWLPDDSLVLTNPKDLGGGSGASYVVSPSGTATLLDRQLIPFGYVIQP